MAFMGSAGTHWRGPWVWPLGGNGPAKVVVLVQLGCGMEVATLGKQLWQAQACACAVKPSAICFPTQDVRFEWQTSFPNKLAFAAGFATNGWLAFAATAANGWLACAANGWLLLALVLPLGLILALAFAFGPSVNRPVVSSMLAALIRIATLAKALAEREILLVANELRVEQGIGDLALPSLPPTLQLNQLPLVYFQQSLQDQ